ncbi:DUF7322 domain-containing protein [Natrononativus amylolyticus]|uniref:DUF7322 domain-containing protein n=1 Tax=Natrononativus amylolyticus TaxID=2963434 RepID=UPI0020CE0815|nr:hypothetical protein [Natrononativus amylolyticus]
MVFERTEHEPEEYDPEAELTDPESDSLTIPEVSTDETDVPPELLKTFWAIVLVVNAAVLAVSLGVLFLLFEADVATGGPLLGGGVVLFGFAVYRYRSFRRSADATDGDDGASETEADDAGDPVDRSNRPD